MDMTNKNNKSLEFKVGLFSFVALILFTLIVFSIGAKSAVFSKKETYHTVFKQVSGLRVGSPIRISGIDVGSVTGVGFRKDGTVLVDLEVEQGAAKLLNSGSKAAIGSKGLLGDKIIDIALGTGTPLKRGANIAPDEAQDLNSYLAQAGRILNNVEGTTSNLKSFTEPLGQPGFNADLTRFMHNVSNISEATMKEHGLIHMLISDEVFARKVKEATTNIAGASGELQSTLAGISTLTREVNHGNGSLHQLIYGNETITLVDNLAKSTGELATMLAAVRTGEGGAHELIYGEGGQDLVTNLAQTSEHLRKVAEDIRNGRGTLGGLLVDPSLYEDLKALVGDLERNEVLRALVRHSIRGDERRGRLPEPRTTETNGQEPSVSTEGP